MGNETKKPGLPAGEYLFIKPYLPEMEGVYKGACQSADGFKESVDPFIEHLQTALRFDREAARLLQLLGDMSREQISKNKSLVNVFYNNFLKNGKNCARGTPGWLASQLREAEAAPHIVSHDLIDYGDGILIVTTPAGRIAIGDPAKIFDELKSLSDAVIIPIEATPPGSGAVPPMRLVGEVFAGGSNLPLAGTVEMDRLSITALGDHGLRLFFDGEYLGDLYIGNAVMERETYRASFQNYVDAFLEKTIAFRGIVEGALEAKWDGEPPDAAKLKASADEIAAIVDNLKSFDIHDGHPLFATWPGINARSQVAMITNTMSSTIALSRKWGEGRSLRDSLGAVRRALYSHIEPLSRLRHAYAEDDLAKLFLMIDMPSDIPTVRTGSAAPWKIIKGVFDGAGLVVEEARRAPGRDLTDVLVGRVSVSWEPGWSDQKSWFDAKAPSRIIIADVGKLGLFRAQGDPAGPARTRIDALKKELPPGWSFEYSRDKGIVIEVPASDVVAEENPLDESKIQVKAAATDKTALPFETHADHLANGGMLVFRGVARVLAVVSPDSTTESIPESNSDLSLIVPARGPIVRNGAPNIARISAAAMAGEQSMSFDEAFIATGISIKKIDDFTLRVMGRDVSSLDDFAFRVRNLTDPRLFLEAWHNYLAAFLQEVKSALPLLRLAEKTAWSDLADAKKSETTAALKIILKFFSAGTVFRLSKNHPLYDAAPAIRKLLDVHRNNIGNAANTVPSIIDDIRTGNTAGIEKMFGHAAGSLAELMNVYDFFLRKPIGVHPEFDALAELDLPEKFPESDMENSLAMLSIIDSVLIKAAASAAKGARPRVSIRFDRTGSLAISDQTPGGAMIEAFDNAEMASLSTIAAEIGAIVQPNAVADGNVAHLNGLVVITPMKDRQTPPADATGKGKKEKATRTVNYGGLWLDIDDPGQYELLREPISDKFMLALGDTWAGLEDGIRKESILKFLEAAALRPEIDIDEIDDEDFFSEALLQALLAGGRPDLAVDILGDRYGPLAAHFAGVVGADTWFSLEPEKRMQAIGHLMDHARTYGLEASAISNHMPFRNAIHRVIFRPRIPGR